MKGKSISTLEIATCFVSENHYLTDTMKITGKRDHTVSITDQKIDEEKKTDKQTNGGTIVRQTERQIKIIIDKLTDQPTE